MCSSPMQVHSAARAGPISAAVKQSCCPHCKLLHPYIEDIPIYNIVPEHSIVRNTCSFPQAITLCDFHIE